MVNVLINFKNIPTMISCGLSVSVSAEVVLFKLRDQHVGSNNVIFPIHFSPLRNPG